LRCDKLYCGRHGGGHQAQFNALVSSCYNCRRGMPIEFLAGWNQRVAVHGVEVWNRIGEAFPELQIWFSGDERILRYSWNDAYYAKQ